MVLPRFPADVVVIGAGVVGLAVARACALAGREVLILEQEKLIGSHTSSRNSEVIHAGIYYPAGSLKAEACVAGRDRLYAYLVERHLPHQQCGKLIAATTDAELSKLAAIEARAAANGVRLTALSGEQVRDLEPALRASGGLLSPLTGIVDSHALMVSFLGDAQDRGAALVLNTRVSAADRLADGKTLLRVEGDEPCEIEADWVINAAGLWACDLAATLLPDPPTPWPVAHYAKGNYFTYQGAQPFSRLIYPVPQPGGLGVHLTLDLAGQARFGPDVQWIDGIDYSLDASRVASFVSAIMAYWPGLDPARLAPGYTGIRPKLAGPNGGDQDFLILGPDQLGGVRQVHMLGIESPGLTASLALADMVAAQIA